MPRTNASAEKKLHQQTAPTTINVTSSNPTTVKDKFVLGGKGRKRLMVFCFMLVVTGGLIQYEKLMKIKNWKDGKVEDHVPFFAFAGIMMTAAGVFGFGRPIWPFFTQLFALLFTLVIAKRASALLDWWDKTTLLLMMLSLVVEYFLNIREHGEE